MAKRSVAEGHMTEWVCKETGEVRYVREIDIKTTDKDFEKVWLAMLMSALDIVGSKKIDVLMYLLANRSKTDNMIIATQEKIADAVKTSRKTVNITLNELIDAKMLVRVALGVYRLSPELIWQGSYWSRMAIMGKFIDESEQKQLPLPLRQSQSGQTPTMNEEKTIAAAPC